MTPAPVPVGRPAARHGAHVKALRDVSDCRDVVWQTSEWVKFLMLEASRARSITLITGHPGVGKSFATARGAEECAADQEEPAEVVWVELSHAARGRSLLQELYPQITGTDPLPTATITELRDDLREALAAPHRLLVLDEAQHVGSQPMRVLRWLMDRPDTDAGLAIVGLPSITASLAPEMRSRVISEYAIEPIPDDEVVQVLSAFHPLFEGADPRLLIDFNKKWARGRFRWWANFLAGALRYGEAMGRSILDEVLAEAVVVTMPRGA